MFFFTLLGKTWFQYLLLAAAAGFVLWSIDQYFENVAQQKRDLDAAIITISKTQLELEQVKKDVANAKIILDKQTKAKQQGYVKLDQIQQDFKKYGDDYSKAVYTNPSQLELEINNANEIKRMCLQSLTGDTTVQCSSL